jgi:peptidoglycan/xylan/chitin deacetylase (PgdA/CDA1 family)
MFNNLPKTANRMLRFHLGGLCGAITHVETNKIVAAFTFDDGPDPVATPQILSILKKYNAKATFFLIGESVERYPDLLQQIAEEGHAIGNHSWDHSSFPILNSIQRRRQMRSWQRVVAPYGSKILRQPYGHQDLNSWLDAISLGYKIVMWNVVGNDWDGRNAESISARIVEKIKPGSIVLLHDGLFDGIKDACFDRKPTILALDLVLRKLSSTFQFLTVPELLKIGRPRKEQWIRKPDLIWLNKLKRSRVRP